MPSFRSILLLTLLLQILIVIPTYCSGTIMETTKIRFDTVDTILVDIDIEITDQDSALYKGFIDRNSNQDGIINDSEIDEVVMNSVLENESVFLINNIKGVKLSQHVDISGLRGDSSIELPINIQIISAYKFEEISAKTSKYMFEIFVGGPISENRPIEITTPSGFYHGNEIMGIDMVEDEQNRISGIINSPHISMTLHKYPKDPLIENFNESKVCLGVSFIFLFILMHIIAYYHFNSRRFNSNRGDANIKRPINVKEKEEVNDVQPYVSQSNEKPPKAKKVTKRMEPNDNSKEKTESQPQEPMDVE